MNVNRRRPKIAVTLGDPAGVGCEVTLKALTDDSLRDSADWLLIGDLSAVRAAEGSTGVLLDKLGKHVVLNDMGMLPKGEQIRFGELHALYGKAAAAYVYAATRMCLDKKMDAMVTAPLNKEAVTMSGVPFTGHTEYIAEICGVNDSRMLLAGVKLSVVHVSTHTSLRHACDLNKNRIIRTIVLGNDAMKLLGLGAPRIAVCGLNPHAGEHGLFGDEDEEFIRPAVEACRAIGIDCEGPVAADTIFLRASNGSHDLIVAMYHDQGHIPMKLLDFETTVNMSLGIPIIRTSVDHGTAFDIAGKGLANDANMRAAMRLAVTMAGHRLQYAEDAQEDNDATA
jgi:4-phospho-D-threonate 3-dehydrogenase / 4-phospho-D-erythronate 3-dehydrogenase